MIYSIYKITNKINNKVYIGFTQQNPAVRFKQHIQYANKCIGKRSTVFHKAIIKYGPDNFNIEIIFQSKSFEDCLIMETYFIEEYKSHIDHPDCNGYNLTTGGRQARRSKATIDKWVKDVASKPKSDEWKKKASENRRKQESMKPPKPILTLEDKEKKRLDGIEKMRKTLLDMGSRGELWVQSEVGRKFMSNKSKGRKQTDNAKLKLSKANSRSFLVEMPNGEIVVITNLRKAGIELGFDQGNMLLHNKAKGFKLLEKDIDPTLYEYTHLDFTKVTALM